MRSYPLPFVTVGLLLSATASVALPADVGRTADVYTNAIRYFEARQNQPSLWPRPESRPVAFAAVELADDIEGVGNSASAAVEPLEVAAESEAQAIAFSMTIDDRLRRAIEVQRAIELALETDLNKPDPFAVALGAAIDEAIKAAQAAERVAATAAPEPYVFAATPDEGLRRAVVALAAAADTQPTEVPAPEVLAADVDESLQDAADAEATSIAVAALSTEPSSISALAFADRFGVADVLQASVATSAAPDATVGSSRQTVSDAADVVDVLASVDTAEPVEEAGTGDLMADMAEADDNLVMRDGGEDGQDTMMMSSDVLFAFGSATLAEDALETLASLGDMAGDVPVIEVFGHTDAIGSEANNLRLGQQRAEAVRAWLLQNTPFTEERVIATGIGEVDPVAPNLLENGDDNPDGRAQNRRVEFAFHEAGYAPE